MQQIKSGEASGWCVVRPGVQVFVLTAAPTFEPHVHDAHIACACVYVLVFEPGGATLPLDASGCWWCSGACLSQVSGHVMGLSAFAILVTLLCMLCDLLDPACCYHCCMLFLECPNMCQHSVGQHNIPFLGVPHSPKQLHLMSLLQDLATRLLVTGSWGATTCSLQPCLVSCGASTPSSGAWQRGPTPSQ